MARWGEGDPRWIVEDRPDATNVNNWHWTEKNATEWSKNKIKELLVGLEVKTDQGTCKIVELKKCEGEATANNRKAKIILFYEFEIEAKWEGNLADSDGDDKVEGCLEIPNVSDENSAEDIDVNFSVESRTDKAYKLKEIMRLTGTGLIRKQFKQFIQQLKDEYCQNLILPTKEAVDSSKSKTSNVVVAPKLAPQKMNESKKENVQTVGVPIPTKSLSLKDEFKCTASELYAAFVRPEMVQAFSRVPCQMDPHSGGRFVIYGGMVEGVFKEMVINEKLVMSWRMKTWPPAHFSEVVLKFVQTEDDTELHLEQSQVPESHINATEDGWKRHYFEAIKYTFGFGARLF